MALVRIWLHPSQLGEHPPAEIGGEDISVEVNFTVRHEYRLDDGSVKEEYVPMISVYDRKNHELLVDVELDVDEIDELIEELVWLRKMFRGLGGNGKKRGKRRVR